MFVRIARNCSAALLTAAIFVLVAISASAAVPGRRAAPSRTHGPAAGSAGSWNSALEPFTAFTASARGVNYGGTTRNREPLVIVLKANGKSLGRITNEEAAKCASGKNYLLHDDLHGTVPISASGSFAAEHTDSEPLGDGLAGQIHETVTGKVQGRKITGVLKTHVDVAATTATAIQDTCDLTAKFTLVSAARREFAGATSQSRPVLVELTGNRAKVNHFHIGWHAPCTPSGDVQYGEFLTSFSIKAGRFGDTWSQRYTEPSGEYEVQDYALSGRIKGTTAKGSFSTRITFFEGSGASLATCESGPVSWKAASG